MAQRIAQIKGIQEMEKYCSEASRTLKTQANKDTNLVTDYLVNRGYDVNWTNFSVFSASSSELSILWDIQISGSIGDQSEISEVEADVTSILESSADTTYSIFLEFSELDADSIILVGETVLKI